MHPWLITITFQYEKERWVAESAYGWGGDKYLLEACSYKCLIKKAQNCKWLEEYLFLVWLQHFLARESHGFQGRSQGQISKPIPPQWRLCLKNTPCHSCLVDRLFRCVFLQLSLCQYYLFVYHTCVSLCHILVATNLNFQSLGYYDSLFLHPGVFWQQLMYFQIMRWLG